MQKKGLIGLIIILVLLLLAVVGFFTVKKFTGEVISETKESISDKQECIQSCIDEGCSEDLNYVACKVEIGENCKAKCIDNQTENQTELNQTEIIITEVNP